MMSDKKIARGLLRLVVHIVQNHHAGKEKSHREETNKGLT